MPPIPAVAPHSAARLLAAVLTAAALLTGSLAPASAQASPITLVQTINQTTAGSSPQPAVAFGGSAYLLAQGTGSDPASDAADLYKTDGTSGGTTLAAALPHPAGDASAGSLSVAGGKLWFTHRSTVGGEQPLWTSDGTSAGTHAVTTWAPALAAHVHGPNIVAATASDLWFTATEPAPAAAPGEPAPPVDLATTLYRLPAGATQAIAVTDFTGVLSDAVTTASGGLFFEVASLTDFAVWHTTGAAGNATSLASGPIEAQASRLGVAGDRAYFQQPDASGVPEIWTGDGTGAATKLTVPAVADAPVGIGSFTASGTSMYVIGNAIDPADVPTADTTLPIWRISGTTLTKIDTPADAHPALGATLATATHGAVWFVAGPDDDRLIWKADDQSATPQQVTPSPAPGDTANASLLGTDGRAIFSLDHGTELWATDGTSANAVQVGTFPQTTASGSLAWFAQAGTRTVFPNATAATGLEPWSTALQTGDAALARDLNAGVRDAGIQRAATMGGNMYFGATDNARPAYQLWKTDGTTAGTSLVAPVTASTRDAIASIVATPAAVAVVTRNRTLWWSDGTGVGTRRIDVPSGSSADFFAMDPTPFGDLVAFTGPGESTDLALWTTDGSDAGTRRVVDLPSDPAGAPDDYEPLYTEAGSQLYFLGFDAAHGYELWHSDGTASGTSIVQDLAPGPKSNIADSIVPAGDHAAFVAPDLAGRQQVWVTNAAGTAVRAITDETFSATPTHLVAGNKTVYFAVGSTLWRSNGNAADRCPVETAGGPIGAIVPVRTGVVYADLSGGLTASSDATGGTLLHRFAAGGIGAMTSTEAGVWITAPSADTGLELWHTDATPAGTALVEDLFPGSSSSNPYPLTVVGTHLVFAAASSAASGRQLFETPLGAALPASAAAVAPCVPKTTPPTTPATTPEVSPPTVDPPAQPAAPKATTPVPTTPVVRVKPIALLAAVAKARDRRSPYRYAFTGRLSLPAAVTARDACTGKVVVTVTRGKHVVARVAAALSASGATCTYRTAVGVSRKTLATSGKLVARVSFAGNARLTAAQSRAITLRYGR